MTQQARVIIIGGGAMGVSALYHLAKLGWRDVLLIEKNELTAGSTWHAAGLCTHFAHNLTIQALRAHSVRLYSGELEQETGSPVSFHQTGALRITRSKDRMDEFRHVKGIGKYSGFDFNLLSPSELKDIYPLVELDGIVGAIHEPLDGHVDPSQATHAMAQGARNNGARILRHTLVTGLARRSSGEWRVSTDKGEFDAEHIVMAAGTWAYEIGCMAGLELPVVPILHQYLVTDRIEAVAALEQELPIIRDPEESWYVRQERDGLIIGPYEKTGKPWSVDQVPPEFGMELLPSALDDVEHIVTAAMERIPVLAEGGIKTVVNGPITFTPDANPLIGPAFGLDNCWLLTGSSMGVMEGGGAGKFLAEWIVGGEAPMDALALDPRRFGAFADRSYRIDKAIESFGNQFAIHFPFEEREAGRPRLTSAIHDEMDAAGAVFGQAYGWERPNWFAPAGDARQSTLGFGRANWFDAVASECATVSQRVGIADMSVFSKFEISGPQASQFMAQLGANSAPRINGRVGLIHSLTKSGGVASEFTVVRLSKDRFYLTSAAAARRQDHDLLRRIGVSHEGVGIADITESKGVIALMGPSAPEVLQSLTGSDLSADDFPWLSAQEIDVNGLRVLAIRVSYVGETGWELHADKGVLHKIYRSLLTAGREFGISPFGAFAINSLRLEKGYPAWGMDLSTERSPFEAGLDRFVKFDGRTFTGCDAIKTRAIEMSLQLIEIDTRQVDAFALHPLFDRDRVCGLVTSGAYGHRTAKSLALAYIDTGQPEKIHDLSVEICGQRYPARRLSKAPYDPENLKLRGTAAPV
ncbi:FAD-dependent oxidoreductase [Pelagibius sp. Alg239-R121]|uniref:GcvT family protein n=1 Tax=Pelagibius sp. Alg239-R121 TaxID=2993448 RepID=UPI0024A6607A|nr:FAD-dependent oxidoreductase [Pelagibius sp. Alg239-R121]